jgi:predicted  nucleic acid-binding Zn-ribbon protein
VPATIAHESPAPVQKPNVLEPKLAAAETDAAEMHGLARNAEAAAQAAQAANEKVARLEAERDELRAQIAGLNATRDEAQAKVARLEAQAEKTAKAQEALATRVADLATDYDRLDRAYQSQAARLDAAERENRSWPAYVANLTHFGPVIVAGFFGMLLAGAGFVLARLARGRGRGAPARATTRLAAMTPITAPDVPTEAGRGTRVLCRIDPQWTDGGAPIVFESTVTAVVPADKRRRRREPEVTAVLMGHGPWDRIDRGFREKPCELGVMRQDADGRMRAVWSATGLARELHEAAHGTDTPRARRIRAWAKAHGLLLTARGADILKDDGMRLAA